MSSAFLIRLLNVHDQPLEDSADVDVVMEATDRKISALHDEEGGQPIRVTNLVEGQVYQIRVFPHRHRPVGVFERAPGSGEREVRVVLPAQPDRVPAVSFPSFGRLDAALRQVLSGSQLEASATQGEALYDSLEPQKKAGLLNVFTKMTRTLFGDGTSVADYVTDIYRIRPDRLFADVKLTLRDQVKSAVSSDLFHEVSAALHTPPPGFETTDSFKTGEAFGNLQLTFFASQAAPLTFKVDADIDDAGGVGHLFQVLRNWITGQPTHPYDIHEILVYNQKIEPGYDLVMTATA